MTADTLEFNDLAMIAMLVSEAFKGVDITRRFPTLWKTVEASPDFQEIFLDALETLERERNGTLLEPLPPTITPDDIKILVSD